VKSILIIPEAHANCRGGVDVELIADIADMGNGVGIRFDPYG